MDTAVVQQFLDFFQDFINLCLSENWPSNNTTENEIKNAFFIAKHIEKCLDALQKQNVMSEFLATLNNNQDVSHTFLKNCFLDPPKCVLKKIINSDCKVTQMDIGFKIFIDLFGETKLEEHLTDFMVEAASKETLLQNINTELPKEKVLNLQSHLFLAELSTCDNPEEVLKEILKKCSENTVELLVFSLINNVIQYQKAQKLILDAFINTILAKDENHKVFWRYLFKINEHYFIKLCIEYNSLFRYIVEALLDCGKLVKENLSMKYFYIELSVNELTSVARKIIGCDDLRPQFLAMVLESGDVDFWESIM